MWSLEERATIHRDGLHRQAEQHRLARIARPPVFVLWRPRHARLRVRQPDLLRLVQHLLRFKRKNPMETRRKRLYAGKIPEDACI